VYIYIYMYKIFIKVYNNVVYLVFDWLLNCFVYYRNFLCHLTMNWYCPLMNYYFYL